MNKFLILKEDNSCMATAMNLYFSKKLFESLDDFERKQRALVAKYSKRYEGYLEENLMSFVKVDGRVYKWSIDYSVEKFYSKYPPILKTKEKIAIVSYRDINKVGHAECIKFDGDKVILIRNPKLKKMPFQDCPLEVLIDLSKNKENNLEVRIFHYSRYKK